MDMQIVESERGGGGGEKKKKKGQGKKNRDCV